MVDFYNRGGDFPSKFTHGDVRQLKLSEADKSALVDFMVGLTDERVRWEKAPFDHPGAQRAERREPAGGRRDRPHAAARFAQAVPGLNPAQP